MDSKNKLSAFEKDFFAVKELFPRLSFKWNSDKKFWVISGELDICDVEGDYWNTFDIAILVPESYPYCVPLVFERSHIIPRHEDWHISNEGHCCIDAENELIILSRRGIRMRDFIAQKVYPYFANQLYKLSEEEYAGEEYKHNIEGIIQHYIEELKIPNVETVVLLLSQILQKADLTRNRLCPCGSEEKIKRCHEQTIDKIKSLGREKISKDLKNIKKSLESS